MSYKNCLNRFKNIVLFFVLIPLILLLLFTYLLSDTIYAQTADDISLQGKIVRNDTGYEGLNVVNGTPSCVQSGPDSCDFQVKYFSSLTSGTLYLTETFTDVEIGDYGGVFNLSLGSGSFTTTTQCNDGECNTPSEVINEFDTLYIEIGFAPGGAGSFTEIFTRTALNASAYAIRSKYAEGSVNDAFKFYNTSSVASTVTGSVYYDTDDNELKLYNGTSWVSVGSAGASAWASEDVSAWTYSAYIGGNVGTLSNFSLDINDDRLSINTDQQRGGLTVYSSYNTPGSWPLVSFKAEGSAFNAAVLELTQDGTGDLLQGYLGSTLAFQFDNNFGMHLNNNGIAYFEPFDTVPTSSILYPNSGEGCLYSVSGSLYWDSSCNGTGLALSTGASSLWTDAGTFSYLSSTTDDLVLGASSTANPPFFFDVSEKRLGIGTSTPQAAIDIAGASSSISNTSGDITIDAADQLVLLSDVELGNGSTTRSLYAYNAARTYYGQIELYNLATGNMTLNTTFESGNIILSPGVSGGVGVGTSTLGTGARLTSDGPIQVSNGGGTMVLLSNNVEGANDYLNGIYPTYGTGFVGMTSEDHYYSGHFSTYGGGFRGMRTTGTYSLELGLFYNDYSEDFYENAGTGIHIYDGSTRFMTYGDDGGRFESDGLKIGYNYPTGVSVVCSDIGGSLPAGTYYFTVTAGALSTTQAWYQDSCTVTAGTSGSATVTWNEVGSEYYTVYKGTSSWGQNLYRTYITGSPYTWTTDSGASSGSPRRDYNYTTAINLSNNSNIYFDTAHNFGIGLTNPSSKLDVLGDARISSVFNVGPSGNSGSIRYNTTNNELEFSNDGSTWIPLADALKTSTLSAEYPGAVLAADGTANVGFMTSDAEGSASNSMNYYEWNSSETSLQDYDIRLRFTIPSDFASWGTNAFTLNLATEAAASTNNKVDIYVYEESSGTVDDSSIGQYSSSAGVWKTTTIQGADLGDCNAAGETCLILIRMYSANDNYVRVGDIDVNYNRKL